MALAMLSLSCFAVTGGNWVSGLPGPNNASAVQQFNPASLGTSDWPVGLQQKYVLVSRELFVFPTPPPAAQCMAPDVDCIGDPPLRSTSLRHTLVIA